MNVVVTGGTGFIGTALTRHMAAKGHTVTVLSRNPRTPEQGAEVIKHVRWDGKSVGEWAGCLDGADVVVNLAGESIGGGVWTRARRERILGSRISATRAIVSAIGSACRRPLTLISGSAVGYYGAVEEGIVTEERDAGSGFLAEVCKAWEGEAYRAEKLGVRVVMPRMSLILGKEGGALLPILWGFNLFIGGPIGSGRQWMPWVHRQDLLQIIDYLSIHSELQGPVNVAAPGIVQMKEFCATVGNVMNRPSWLPVPSAALRMLLGELSSTILTGQRVVPSRLLDAGYRFTFPSLEGALRDILQ